MWVWLCDEEWGTRANSGEMQCLGICGVRGCDVLIRDVAWNSRMTILEDLWLECFVDMRRFWHGGLLVVDRVLDGVRVGSWGFGAFG